MLALKIILKAPKGVTRIAGANAYAAKLAISPTIIVIIPAHHQGSYKYPYPPSPALAPLTPAFLRPFFLMMKLEPMNILEDTAKMTPCILSGDISSIFANIYSLAYIQVKIISGY